MKAMKLTAGAALTAALLAGPALAQPEAGVEGDAARVSSACVAAAQATPADSAVTVYESRIAASVEESGAMPMAVRLGLTRCMGTGGLSQPAVQAVRNLLASRTVSLDQTGALAAGFGGAAFSVGPGFVTGGGGSDYRQ